MNTDLKKQFRKCDSGESLTNLLLQVEIDKLMPEEVEFLNHVIDRVKPTADLSIAFLANHTIDPLARYMNVYCATQECYVSTYIGNYDQYFQEVLDPNSKLFFAKPNFIFLSLLLHKIAPSVSHHFLSLEVSQKEEEITRIITLIKDWAGIVKEKTDATVLISNFPRPLNTQSGLADLQLQMGEAEFYARLNIELAETFRDDQRIFIFDSDHILSSHGKKLAVDRKMYHLAKIAWAESANLFLARQMWAYIRAVSQPAKKCLVLDLDNTLWGGIVGEDGVHGIKIGQGDAEAEAYLDFQYEIRSLLDRGIILAICSKNNPADVDEVFENRDEMVLKKDDFAAIKVNWNPKYINIQDIAAELNIGIDSLVFMDDNPAECELVREALPDVKTVHLSGDPSNFRDILNNLNVFEKLFLTEEDKTKYVQYRQNAKREQDKKKFKSIDEYLQKLGTKAQIKTATEGDLPRAHQLFTKTNQFNVTTKRYTPAEIESFLEDDSYHLKLFQVEDNFGDLGIVGLYLVQRDDDTARIDSFILSCRALGRGLETFIMNQLKNEFLYERGCKKLIASFIQTRKNIPAAKFFRDQGFEKVGEDGAAEFYELLKNDAQIIDCPGILDKSDEV